MIHYILLTFSLCSFVFTQAFEVQNVTASQRTDGSHIVDACYDLSPDDLFISFRIWTELSVDAGENWMGLHIPTTPNIMGDNVFPGSNKCFEISLGDYISDTYSSSAQIKVFAEGHEALELPFEMVPVASGEFMGALYTPGSADTDTLSTIDYDYEIMKYEVTNAQFAQFLLEAKSNGYLIYCNGPGLLPSNPSDLCVDNMPIQAFPVDNTYWGDTGVIGEFSHWGHSLFTHGTEPGETNNGAIYWNGTTFIIDEGYANHPAIRVSYYGAWAFANYYGLRIPSRDEWIKAARGMNDWQAAFGPEAGNPTPGNRVNTSNSGDPFDTYPTGNARNTTPVGFYNGESNQWDFETIDSPSPYGTYDQTGNASEWVSDMFSANHGGSFYMMGGSFNGWWWNGAVAYFNTSHQSSPAANESISFGFRCARTIVNSSTQEIPSNSKIIK